MPDSNDNHSMRRLNNMDDECGWTEVADVSTCRPVLMSDDSTNCLLPNWARGLLKNSLDGGNSSESETEEDLRHDDRRISSAGG